MDGELAPKEIAELTDHLVTCPICARNLAELGALRLALAEAIPEGEVTEAFSSRISAMLNNLTEEAQSHGVEGGRVVPFIRRYRPPTLAAISYSVATAAIAATMVFTLMRQPDNKIDLAAVRDASLRTSLVSNDVQGTTPANVAGYRVVGARYDLVAGHRARVVIYQGATDVVTLCSWAANGEPAHGVKAAVYRGTNVMYWNDGATEFWAASNAPGIDLKEFVKGVRGDTI
jgi:anti-sigma factor RsiW